MLIGTYRHIGHNIGNGMMEWHMGIACSVSIAWCIERECIGLIDPSKYAVDCI
jgi:hypothetical protein